MIALAVVLTVLAIATKWAAGFVVPGARLRRVAIGAAMVPRGEVGLIFAQVGLAARAISSETYAAVVVVMMATRNRTRTRSPAGGRPRKGSCGAARSAGERRSPRWNSSSRASARRTPAGRWSSERATRGA